MVFSEIYLRTELHQIRVKNAGIEKTAFNTKNGQSEYLLMPMRLCNALVTFHSLTNRIFYNSVDAFMGVYMDDLLIFIKNEKSHSEHLNIILSRFKAHNL